MKRLQIALLLSAAILAGTSNAAPVLAPPVPPGKAAQPYIKIASGRIALTHVRVIDGTGAPALEDRTVLIDGETIAAIQPASAPVPADYRVVEASGKTLLPGWVGMHNHLYYLRRPNLDATGHSEPPILGPQMSFSSPRLYLAAGVTTLRTTGTAEPYTDLNIKREIDAGAIPGPHIDVTGPYLDGTGNPYIGMHRLPDVEAARRTVAFWANEGVNSFKAYRFISRAQLKAAIEEAHKRGIKVTGHLCSVTYPEAVALGIDNLEHGFIVNTQLDPGKQPDICPNSAGIRPRSR